MKTVLAVIGGGVLLAALFFCGAVWGISQLIAQPDELDIAIRQFEEAAAAEVEAREEYENLTRDVGCELKFRSFTVEVPAELVQKTTVAYRGSAISPEPVVGADGYFDRAGCDQQYHWRRGQDGEAVTLRVLANDWPNEEAVVAALRNGQPVFGILADCGNPIVINAVQLPELTAPAEPTSAFWSPGQLAPTATLERAVLVTPTRQAAPAPQRGQATPEAATVPPSPDDGFGSGCAFGGACEP